MTTSRQFLRFHSTFLRLSAGALLGMLALSSALAGCDGGLADGTGGGTVGPGAGGAPLGTGGGGPTTGGSGPTGGGSAAGGGGSGDPVNSACGSTDAPFKLYAEEANNIKLTSSVGLPPTPMKKGDPEVTFDWSGITKDMFGNPMTAADVTHAVMVVWYADMTNLEDIANRINTDSPDLDTLAQMAVFVPVSAEKKSAKLSEFLNPGLEPVTAEQIAESTDGSKILTLMLQRNPEVPATTAPGFGYGVKMIQGMALEDAGPTMVMLTDTSTAIQATPDLISVQDTLVPAGSNNISIDWTSTISTRGYGTNLPFPNNYIAEVVVARYSAETDLSTQFTRLEGIPLDLWRGNVVAGSSFLLSDAGFVNEKNPGTPFTGVPAGTTDQYLLMLLCAKDICRNPTPWYISPLTTCP